MKISNLGEKEYSREELEAIKEEIEQRLADPEFRPWRGLLVEGSDDEVKWSRPVYYKHYDTNNVCPHRVKTRPEDKVTIGYNYVRPLQDPNIIQFKPHDGSAKRPCRGDLYVRLMLEDGSIASFLISASVCWSHVVAWAPVDGWGTKWWRD